MRDDGEVYATKVGWLFDDDDRDAGRMSAKRVSSERFSACFAGAGEGVDLLLATREVAGVVGAGVGVGVAAATVDFFFFFFLDFGPSAMAGSVSSVEGSASPVRSAMVRVLEKCFGLIRSSDAP